MRRRILEGVPRNLWGSIAQPSESDCWCVLLWKKRKCLSPVITDQGGREHAIRLLVPRGPGELTLSLVRTSVESVLHIKPRFQLGLTREVKGKFPEGLRVNRFGAGCSEPQRVL